MAILQLSNLLGCPDPIPTVESFLTKTIAFDFTNLQILNANNKLLKVLLFGFVLDTILKSFFEKILLSVD